MDKICNNNKVRINLDRTNRTNLKLNKKCTNTVRNLKEIRGNTNEKKSIILIFQVFKCVKFSF